MNEVKFFLITGEIVKPNFKTNFSKEVRALEADHAIEQIYTDIGSKHRAKRFQIKINKIEEIPAEAVQSTLLKKLLD